MISLDTARVELAALLSSAVTMPFPRLLASESLMAPSPHPTPVVFVHGLCGSPTNFWALRRHLARRGVARFGSFRYPPRLDYQALAPWLGTFIDALCKRNGVSEVDVVGHSLGGIIARYLIEHGDGARVRRLVSLGAPWYGTRFPSRELALFGAEDWLIPTPTAPRAHGQVVNLPGCGHLGLLYDLAAHEHVASFLTAPRGTIRLAIGREHRAA